MDYNTKLSCTIIPKIDFDREILEIGEHLESPFNDIIGNHYRTIINTKEKMIRDGLIALGWTPPEL